MVAQAYPDAWETLRARHHAILCQSIEANNGYIFQMVGDAFCAAFHTAPDAIKAALAAQQVLQGEDWRPAPIRVRMGINTGMAQLKDSNGHEVDYVGYAALARTARVMAVGSGGQILLSSSSNELARGELLQGVSLRDMGQHRLKGLLNLEHIWQVDQPGLLHDFPSLKTLNAIPNNLPAQLTSFIGREKEIEEVKQQLQGHRLVTLVGPGGTGKSRLSLQIAADVLDAYVHGVWLIELASLSDPGLVASAILSGLSVSEQKGMTALQALEEYLAEKTLLIILDNCEHLIEVCADTVQRILKTSLKVSILASSRESLGVSGEVSWPVSSLSLPNPNSSLQPEQLTQYEAVRLFIERVQLVVPRFTITAANASVIAQICYRLDGIPLALELAAARAKSLSVEQIMSRLDDRFRLLTSGSRTALPRQQTLRALIDWSYDLLSGTEKLLLSRLSVFAGGWTLELAEQVCSDDNLDVLDIFDLQGNLVDKSLVVLEEENGVARYRILETIRQYAYEKLIESSEDSKIRVQHCAIYVEFAERAEPEIRGEHTRRWMSIVDAEFENIRSALNWALEKQDAIVVTRVCLALRDYFCWNMKVVRREIANYCRAALELVERDPELLNSVAYPLLITEKIFHEVDCSLNVLLEPATMLSMERAVLMLEGFNFPKKSCYSFWQLSVIYARKGNYESAVNLMLKCLKGLQQVKDEEGVSRTLDFLADLHWAQGNIDEAKNMFSHAIERYRKSGDLVFALASSLSVVRLIYESGDVEKAKKLLISDHLLAKRMELDVFAQQTLRFLGEIACLQGDLVVAEKYFAEADEYSAKVADRFREDYSSLAATADLAFAAGDMQRALFCCEKILEDVNSSESSQFAGGVKISLGWILLYSNRLEDAVREFEQAICLLEKSGTLSIYDAWFGLGEASRMKGDIEIALGHYQKSLFFCEKLKKYLYSPPIFDGIAKLMLLNNRLHQSAKWFGFSDKLRIDFGTIVSAVQKSDYDKHIGILKWEMNQSDFETAWLEGRSMDMKTAFALALEGFDKAD